MANKGVLLMVGGLAGLSSGLYLKHIGERWMRRHNIVPQQQKLHEAQTASKDEEVSKEDVMRQVFGSRMPDGSRLHSNEEATTDPEKEEQDVQ